MNEVKRLKFLYDRDGNAIGKVDDEGNLYTMDGNPSSVYARVGEFMQINKKHLEREYSASLLDSDEEE